MDKMSMINGMKVNNVMKDLREISVTRMALLFLLLLLSTLIVACSSGGGGGGSTGVMVGVVKSVNGNSAVVGNFNINASGATVQGDDVNSMKDLQAGMLVVIKGDFDDNHNSADAHDIEYDVEVKGRVDSIDTGMMVVIGQNVDITHNPVFVSKMLGIASITDIPVGAMVAVSGYSDNMGNIIATFVKLEDHMATSADKMEVEGIIQALDYEMNTFMIGNQLIYFDPTLLNFTLENGMNVEVHLMMDDTGNLHAVKVERDDEYYDGHDDIEIEGMVTGGLNPDGTFMINGITVKLADNVKYKDGLSEADIVEGAILEVEGYMDGSGMLVVTKISSEHEEGHDMSAPGTGMTPTP